MKKSFAPVCCLLLIFVMASFHCGGGGGAVSYREDLENNTRKGTLLLYAQDTTLYSLNSFILRDSSIEGTGTARKFNKTAAFQGSVPLHSILYAEYAAPSTRHTILMTAGCIALGALAIAHISRGESSFKAEVHTEYHAPYSGGSGGGGGSCPFIYSFAGNTRRLEGEAFGIALGKAREMRTFTPLREARAADGTVKIRLSNERPETHFFNEVQLLAADIPKNAELVYDDRGVPLAVENIQPPLCAIANGANVTAECSRGEGVYWQSALAPAAQNNFEDEIEIAFRPPADADSSVFMLNAINTHLSNVVFKQLFGFLGEQILPFYHAVDTDREMNDILDGWTDESSLKVSMYKNGAWVHCATLAPEANEVAFSKAVRLAVPKGADVMRLRLRCLADVWKIDRAGMSWGNPHVARVEKAELLSAVTRDGKDIRKNISGDDSQYESFYPPQWMDLGFRAPKETRGQKRVYIAAVKGYLYEWNPEKNREAKTSYASFVPEENKVEFVKNLLKHKEMFLPSVFAEWKQYKSAGNSGR